MTLLSGSPLDTAVIFLVKSFPPAISSFTNGFLSGTDENTRLPSLWTEKTTSEYSSTLEAKIFAFESILKLVENSIFAGANNGMTT